MIYQIYENNFRRNREETRRKFQVERTREKEEGRKTDNKQEKRREKTEEPADWKKSL